MCCASACRPSGLLSWMVSWLTFAVAPAVSGIAALISAAHSVRSGSGLAMTRSTLLSPFILAPLFFAGKATADYAHGRAVLHRKPDGCLARLFHRGEEPRPEWNVDSRTGLKVHPVLRPGPFFFTGRIYNRVAATLAKKFGRQPEDWQTRLPRPEKALAALRGGREATAKEIARFPALAAIAVPPPGTADGSSASCVSVSPSGPSIRVAVVDDRFSAIGRGSLAVLFETATGREVARCGEPPMRTEPGEIHCR